MATEYAFQDDSGLTRFEGFIVPSPGSPILDTRCIFSGPNQGNTATTCNSGDYDFLALEAWTAPPPTDPTLMDFTNPLHPTVVQAGKYGVAVQVTYNAGAIPGGHVAYIELDIMNGADVIEYVSVSADLTPEYVQAWLTSPAVYIPAGGIIQVQVNQNTGGDLPFHVYNGWLEPVQLGEAS